MNFASPSNTSMEKAVPHERPQTAPASFHEVRRKQPSAVSRASRGEHATQHMPVETAKCWWLLILPFSKACPNPLKNGLKPLAKLYNSPKNSGIPTA